MIISNNNLREYLIRFLFIICAIKIENVFGVDKNNFKTCAQSGFCKRQRNYKPDVSPYVVNFDTVNIDSGHLTANVINQKNSVVFKLDLFSLTNNRFRFKFNELNPIKTRFEVPEVIVENLENKNFASVRRETNLIELKTDSNNKAILYANPFKLEFYIGDYLVTSFNSKNLLKFEHLRTKPNKIEPIPADAEAEVPPADAEKPNENQNVQENKEEEEPDMWEETFKTHTDSKPNGPESVGMDISFNDFQHVYGIPQHADSFTLKSTTNTDPYRLYNLDVFEYELNNPMALYGSIPFMVAHNQKFTIGLLWLNAAETWIDISSNFADKGIFSKVAEFITKSNEIPQVDTHWFSESGIIDVFVFLGPKPGDIFKQYSSLTGSAPLPPLFSLAYHQCRWNYNDEQDVKNVNAGFEEHQIPMDVMWLDIEHTNDKRYFTWDALKFPNSLDMLNHLHSYGRKMVTIVDPHIKIDSNYPIYSEAKDNNYFVKDKNGNNVDGWCWPGSSSWPDYLNPEVRKWWASKFLLENYKGTTLDTYTWNDMNEPSMFNGPEVTFHKDAVHYDGFEHRNSHNMYGQMVVRSTFQGHLERANGERRPFILTRSTFVGSQRFGAVWTGDNAADWDHLKISIPMCLSFSIAGMGFCGADIGGFFKNPDAELMVRWYQAAAYQPFFRSHAHIDTKRREPWLFGESNLNLIREAVHARYALLYYWYTLFHHFEKTGEPPMLPLWVSFPNETSLYSIEDQHMIGHGLMIKPITTQGATSVDVVFPGKDEIWYDVKSMRAFDGGVTKTFTDINLGTIPVFQRGGWIIPYKFRLRRSSSQMGDDPFSLLVTLNAQGTAQGELYFDDGISFNHEKKKEFVHRQFRFNNNELKSTNVEPGGSYKTKAWIERVIIYGYKNKPKTIKIEYDNNQSAQLQFTYDPAGQTVLIRKPGVKIDSDWSILIN